jgi:hemolysin type calcium-binding protein
VRWTLIGLTVASLLGVALVVSAQPNKAPGRCTQTGTAGRDIMRGRSIADVLCARRGDDFLHGADGDDLLRAGRDADVAVGAGGRDVLRGGRGNDRLFAVDDRGGERVVGGPGRDQCFTDRGDQVFGCERTFRGLAPSVVHGLERVAFQVMGIALEVPTITLPPPPVGTVTVVETTVVTVTVPFPPCTPPPNSPPPPC